MPVQRKAVSDGPAAAADPGARAAAPHDDPFALHLEARPIQAAGEVNPFAEAPPARTGGGAPLPDGVRAKMERSLGSDFSSVRVHEGAEASSIGARAYTQGTDVHFAPGQYDPHGETGQLVRAYFADDATIAAVRAAFADFVSPADMRPEYRRMVDFQRD